MRENYARLLIQLQKNPNGIGGSQLAENLNVSTRTIRNYVKDLNDNYLSEGKILADSKNGYILQGSINNLTETDQLIFEQRAFFIIKQLLSADGTVTYEQIAEQLHYSVQTIRNDIYKIQELIESEQRNVTIDSIIFQGVQVTGEELACRLLLASYCNPNQISTEQLIHDMDFYFTGWTTSDEVHELADEVYQGFEERHIRCTVPLLQSVLVYLIIAAYRQHGNHAITKPLQSSAPVNNEMKELAETLYRTATRIISGTEADQSSEVKSFYWFLVSQQFAEPDSDTYFKLNPKIEGWVKDSLVELDNSYHQLFADDAQLIRDLTMHISRDILPLEANFFIENSYLHHIKTDYVIAYQYAVSFAHELNGISGVELPDNEIGYVALHFAAFIERHRSRNVSAAIVYGAHSVTYRLLAHRIEELFPNLRITQLINASAIDSIAPVDFVIASERVVLNIDKSVVTIHDMLTPQDVSEIEKQMNQLVLNNVLRNSVLIHSEAHTPEEVIKEILDAIHRPEILQDVLDREQLSSTETGSFAALPHPLVMRSGYPFQMGVAVMDRPVTWGGQEVKLVILPLPDPDNNNEYEQIFGILQKIIANDANVSKLESLRKPADLLHLI